jgi:hypothetical protein
MVDNYATLRKKYTDLATWCARKAVAASGCEITLLRYQLELELQCWRNGTCASTRLDWLLVLATHNPQALFDYHISKLVARSCASNNTGG